MFTGMEWSNQEIHGQMVQSTSHSAQSNQDQTSLMKSYFPQKKELCGGMLIVIGHVPPSMVPLLFYPEKELPTLFLNLMKKKQ